MNKKLVIALILALTLNLLAVPMVMAEEKKEEETYTLDELVVIASKHPEKLSEASVSVEIIDEEDIEKKNAQNVADLLRDVSSVNISDYGSAAGQKTVDIRGTGGSRVLVLIDGQPLNSPQNKSIDLSQLSTNQIEEIEVLKGPASSLYGASALGGVINITTKSGSEEPITNVEIGFGSFNTQKYNLTHRGSTNNLGYNISVLKRDSDGHRENPDNDDLNQDNIFTKFNYKLSDYSDLIFSLQYDDSSKGVPGSLDDKTPESTQEDEDVRLNLQWKKQMEDNDQNLRIFYNDHEQIYNDNKHDTKRKGFEFNRTDYYQFHNLTYGLEVKNDEIESGGIKEDYTNKAVFIHDSWKLNEPLKINFGARYDDHEEFGSETSPRLGLVYAINSNLNFHTSAGKAYRVPTFNDIQYGDPDLKPEVAKAYETGIRYLNNDFKGELNVFKKDIDDYIDWLPVSGWHYPFNLDAEIKGAELIIAKQLAENLSTDFNYTYLDTKNKDTGRYLDYKPKHTANFGVDYDKQNMNVRLNGKLVGEQKEWDNDNEESIVIPSYFVADLKLNRELTNDVKVSLEINNLLDRDYQVVDGYPMPERNYMLEMSKKF